MPSSVRLDKETESLLRKAARYLGKTKSDLLRESIKEYCTAVTRAGSAWKIYESVHESGGSGHGKRLLNRRSILKKKLDEMKGRWY